MTWKKPIASKFNLLTFLSMTSYRPHIPLDSSPLRQYIFLSLSGQSSHYGFFVATPQWTWTPHFFKSFYFAIIISLICKNGEYSSIFTIIATISHMHPIIMHSIHLYVENLDLFAMSYYVHGRIRILLLVCNLLNCLLEHLAK